MGHKNDVRAQPFFYSNTLFRTVTFCVVMGMTFGSRVLDWSLTKSSAKVEIGALLISILIGAIIGFSSFWATDDFENWPTEEMRSRGDITGLFTGIAIAIPRCVWNHCCT